MSRPLCRLFCGAALSEIITVTTAQNTLMAFLALGVKQTLKGNLCLGSLLVNTKYA